MTKQSGEHELTDQSRIRNRAINTSSVDMRMTRSIYQSKSCSESEEDSSSEEDDDEHIGTLSNNISEHTSICDTSTHHLSPETDQSVLHISPHITEPIIPKLLQTIPMKQHINESHSNHPSSYHTTHNMSPWLHSYRSPYLSYMYAAPYSQPFYNQQLQRSFNQPVNHLYHDTKRLTTPAIDEETESAEISESNIDVSTSQTSNPSSSPREHQHVQHDHTHLAASSPEHSPNRHIETNHDEVQHMYHVHGNQQSLPSISHLNHPHYMRGLPVLRTSSPDLLPHHSYMFHRQSATPSSNTNMMSPTSDTSSMQYLPSPMSAIAASPSMNQPVNHPMNMFAFPVTRPARSVDDFDVNLHHMHHYHHHYHGNAMMNSNIGQSMNHSFQPHHLSQVHPRPGSDHVLPPDCYPHEPARSEVPNEQSVNQVTHHKRERGKEIVHIATANRVFQITEYTASYDESLSRNPSIRQSINHINKQHTIPEQQNQNPPRAHLPPAQQHQQNIVAKPEIAAPVSAKKSKRPKANFDAISFSELIFHELIGEGSFGQVFRGTLYGQEVAIKRIRNQTINQSAKQHEQFLRSFKQEVKIMKALRHPNITTLLGACMESPNLCLVTEYLSSGSLEDVLNKMEKDHANQSNGSPLPRSKWSLKRIISLAKDIARGVGWLHMRGIIHRDLKSANVLIDQSGKAKICDFGLSHIKRRVSPANDTAVYAAGGYSSTLNNYGQCGSLGYMAPEVIKRQHYGVAADIFSFGVCLCELLLGRYPYERTSHTVNQSINPSHQPSTGAFENALMAGLRPTIVSYCPKLIKEMIEACLSEDPSKRPTMEQIFNVLVQAEQQLSANESHSMFDDCPPAILEVIRAQKHDLDVLEASAKNNATLLKESEKRIHELEASVEAERRAREKAEMTVSLLQQALSSNHNVKPGNSPTLGMVRSNSAMIPTTVPSPQQNNRSLLREISSNSDSTGVCTSPSRRSSISNPPLCVSPPLGQSSITVGSTGPFSPRQQSIPSSARSSLTQSSALSPRSSHPSINSCSPVLTPSPLLASSSSVSAPGASCEMRRMSSQSPRSPFSNAAPAAIPGC